MSRGVSSDVNVRYPYTYTPQKRIGVRGWREEGGEKQGGEEETMRAEEEGGERREKGGLGTLKLRIRNTLR